MKSFPWILSAVLIVILAIIGNGRCSGDGGQRVAITDTVTVYDTVTITQPVLVDSIVVRYKTVSLKVADTTTVLVYDSIRVEIPIEQKRYEGDNYSAWVSGYEATLDSIKILDTKEIITEKVIDDKRMGVGVVVGGGFGNGGLTPFIGIGLQYNIVRW